MEWPEEALRGVATHFLQKVAESVGQVLKTLGSASGQVDLAKDVFTGVVESGPQNISNQFPKTGKETGFDIRRHLNLDCGLCRLRHALSKAPLDSITVCAKHATRPYQASRKCHRVFHCNLTPSHLKHAAAAGTRALACGRRRSFSRLAGCRSIAANSRQRICVRMQESVFELTDRFRREAWPGREIGMLFLRFHSTALSVLVREVLGWVSSQADP